MWLTVKGWQEEVSISQFSEHWSCPIDLEEEEKEEEEEDSAKVSDIITTAACITMVTDTNDCSDWSLTLSPDCYDTSLSQSLLHHTLPLLP